MLRKMLLYQESLAAPKHKRLRNKVAQLVLTELQINRLLHDLDVSKLIIDLPRRPQKIASETIIGVSTEVIVLNLLNLPNVHSIRYIPVSA